MATGTSGSIHPGQKTKPLPLAQETTTVNTAPTDPSETTYTMGYSEDFQKLLRRRNAKSDAAHLLPHLEPGLRVLDLGCGPGTISVGLAQAVAPGEVHGVDIEASQIALAQTAAADGGHHNAVFQTGDATALDFADNTFDVVHCHAVLMHVPDTQAVLAEVIRVLKPGGIFSSRDLIAGSSFFEPDMGDLGNAWITFASLLKANGGHPQMGKELKRLFLEAGFSDVAASASFESYSTVEDIEFLYNFSVGWFFSPDTVGAAVKHGLASQEQFDSWLSMLDEWKTLPGAFGAFSWGEVIGRKPEPS